MTRSKLALSTTLAAIGLTSSLALLSTAHADYPEQDIRLIIPYGPGGATDIIFRLVSQEAEQHLGASIVPVNMAGAGATLGSRNVKDATPDGYTLLGSHDTIALSKLAGTVDYSYDAFEPIALLTQTINIPTTYAGHPVESAADIADYVRENPGQVRFSMIPSSTDHFFWAQFFQEAGIDMADVRLVGYPDTGQQVSALMAEEVDFAMFNLPSGGAFYEDGTFKPLGIAHPERLDSMPDVATLREQGIEMDHSTSRGIFAPKDTPQEVLDAVAEAYGQALEEEQVQSRIENEFGSVVRFLAGEDYQAFLEENEAALSAAAENIDFQN
ncbi:MULTISPECIES: tripartite tricarboxylate transporter substrate binding protein [Halomonadaceae]|jgi:tripartite-type tricarboxylate transporter receptor subunit TctC|uniref:Tripartite tricarboxylate transporter substrate binding protein n=1 Tax=Vreelandella piezotolerans TaxID=2609667 RepID=A0ABQ6XCV5_9GAMM|nr:MULTISPECIES: tripartite tricarboxylate transporter substrate binding protein [Halomonas]KAE8439842.1 tripartite tricarboxylate transporter substrate binding protein [Halomonas piezotolerans]MCG7589322.1 tripartite tricarboxylate transporter substrate binding protein [Halomonas sp. McD50-5]MCG7615483.1 tripartite tricarboxylate transporter substrate binding protein [Halomonas sp. McD50-4]QJA23380.1 tripartite tricarboxylate transporter substrate binding protein [Halomonas piezotolerans]TNH1